MEVIVVVLIVGFIVLTASLISENNKRSMKYRVFKRCVKDRKSGKIEKVSYTIFTRTKYVDYFQVPIYLFNIQLPQYKKEGTSYNVMEELYIFTDIELVKKIKKLLKTTKYTYKSNINQYTFHTDLPFTTRRNLLSNLFSDDECRSWEFMIGVDINTGKVKLLVPFEKSQDGTITSCRIQYISLNMSNTLLFDTFKEFETFILEEEYKHRPTKYVKKKINLF